MPDPPCDTDPGPTPPGRPSEPGGTSRRRSTWRVLVPVAMLGAGLLFGTSAVLSERGAEDREAAGLPDLVHERSADVDALTVRAADLEAEIKALQAADTGADTSRTEMAGAVDALAPGIGTAAVTGPALQVVLDDAGYTLDTLPQGFTVDDVIVHQQDVQGAVNALWAGGAEAIMLQDQRLVSTSAIRCVGNTLYLQGRVYSPPYTITAVGDVDGMARQLEQDPIISIYRQYVEQVGLGWGVDRVGERTLPAYTGSTGLTPEVAEPTPAAGDATSAP